MDESLDNLYEEAMFMADMYGIPKVLVDDYYNSFVEFVREELDKRVKTGQVNQEIHPEILLTVIMGEANID